MVRGLTAAAAVGAMAGCSREDSRVFVTPAEDGPASAATPLSAGVPSSASAGRRVSAKAAMSVSFTYTVGAGGVGRDPAASPTRSGPIRNPYIAVWVETPGEELVTTIAIWHLQRQERWLKSLKRWSAVSGGYETHTGPTRKAGLHTVKWNCTANTGARVPLGDYWICIEAARERGPYQLIRDGFTLGTESTRRDLVPSGELVAASLAYTP
jgi:hypothetical protein